MRVMLEDEITALRNALKASHSPHATYKKIGLSSRLHNEAQAQIIADELRKQGYEIRRIEG